ncbi:hypothetical protein E4T56_gene13854 [Termitomyces sp. T112]|nr:hypothetical protein E4T56_gene13854 [Termitomyces sp. T112]
MKAIRKEASQPGVSSLPERTLEKPWKEKSTLVIPPRVAPKLDLPFEKVPALNEGPDLPVQDTVKSSLTGTRRKEWNRTIDKLWEATVPFSTEELLDVAPGLREAMIQKLTLKSGTQSRYPNIPGVAVQQQTVREKKPPNKVDVNDLPMATYFIADGTQDDLPTGRYTPECKEIIDQAHGDGFLWPEEMKAVHHLMMLQNEAFAWDDSQRGRLKEEFFPPVVMPVIPHTPWVLKNIPIAPGLRDKICQMIKQKIEAGVYEPSNSSYRSQWFTVLKKDGPNATIMRWIEDVLLYYFTLRHVPGKTFSVDGLSRRLKQPGEEEYPPVNSELVDNSKTMHFEYPAKNNNEPGWEDWEPLALEEFADQIDTRGGYLHAVATEVSDFEQELDRARSQEVELRKAVLSQQQTSRMDPAAVLSLSQPLLPIKGTEEEEEADLQAYLEHRKSGESEQ